MKVQLGKFGEIKQGVVLNRIKPKEGEKAKLYPLLTISRLLQEEEGIYMEEQQMIEVSPNKTDSLRIAKEGMIVIGLTSFHKAVVLTKEKEGMIIPSNFLILEFPGGIMDAHYFAWYFNESPYQYMIKNSIIHGEGKIKVLSIQQIRNMEIEIPDLVTQMAVGKLYSLQLQKARLLKQILRKEMADLTDRMSRLIGDVTELQVEIDKDFVNILYEQLNHIDRKIKMYEKELKLFIF